MRSLLLFGCAALLFAPQANAQEIGGAEDESFDPPPLYRVASVAAIAGSIGMTLTNLHVLESSMSDETKGVVGIGFGVFSIFLAHMAYEAEYHRMNWQAVQLGAGGMSILAGLFRLVRADAAASSEAQLHLAPWRDPQGGSGLRIHFAF